MIHLTYEDCVAKYSPSFSPTPDGNDNEEEMESETVVAVQNDTKPETSAVDFCDDRKQYCDLGYKDEKKHEGKDTLDEPAKSSKEHLDKYLKSHEEERPHLKKKMAESAEDNDFWERKNAAEKAVCALVKASKDSRKVSVQVLDDSTAVEYLQIKDKELIRRIAKHIIMEVYARIGCFENFLRLADWADEPGSAQRNIINESPPLTNNYSVEDSFDKMESDGVETNERPSSTPLSYEDTFAEESYEKEDCRQLPVLQVAFDNEGVAETSFSIPNAPEPIKEGIGEPSVIVTTPIDGSSKPKENSFAKHSPGKWPPVFHRKLGSSSLNTGSEESECSDEESCSEFSDDEERIAPFKDFISLKGAKTKDGEDILVLNPSKIPSKRDFTGEKEYGEVMDSLFLYAQKFTEEKIETDKFVLLVYSMNQRRSRLRSRKWAAEFYKLLKERYLERMARCVFYKPSFKLRAMMILSWPFLADDMKEKICIVKSRRDFFISQSEILKSLPALNV